MKVRALRGVCIGVDQHLVAGGTADLEAAQVQFLVSIGAVERIPDAPAGKPARQAVEPVPTDPVQADLASPTSPAKPGKGEK